MVTIVSASSKDEAIAPSQEMALPPIPEIHPSALGGFALGRFVALFPAMKSEVSSMA